MPKRRKGSRAAEVANARAGQQQQEPKPRTPTIVTDALFPTRCAAAAAAAGSSSPRQQQQQHHHQQKEASSTSPHRQQPQARRNPFYATSRRLQHLAQQQQSASTARASCNNVLLQLLSNTRRRQAASAAANAAASETAELQRRGRRSRRRQRRDHHQDEDEDEEEEEDEDEEDKEQYDDDELDSLLEEAAFDQDDTVEEDEEADGDLDDAEVEFSDQDEEEDLDEEDDDDDSGSSGSDSDAEDLLVDANGFLQAIATDDDEDDEDEEKDEDDEPRPRRRSTSISVSRHRSRSKSLHDDDDDDSDEEEDDDLSGGRQLVIEAEIDPNSDPRQTRRMLNRITTAACQLAAVCPNFSSMRVIIPPSASASSSSGGGESNRFLLPPRDLQKFAASELCVVVDLDETILQGRTRGAGGLPAVIVRPHLEDLVAALRRSGAEIIVWTAGERAYANHILGAVTNYRPPATATTAAAIRNNNNNAGSANNCSNGAATQTLGKFWHHLITRENCLHKWFDAGVGRHHHATLGVADSSAVLTVKDLSWLGRSVERCLVIENSPVSVCHQPSSAVLVPDFHGSNPGDRSLAIVSEVVGAVSNAFHDRGETSVAKALQRCSQLELCGFRIPGVRGTVSVRTLTYSPPGGPRTFGEEGS